MGGLMGEVGGLTEEKVELVNNGGGRGRRFY